MMETIPESGSRSIPHRRTLTLMAAAGIAVGAGAVGIATAAAGDTRPETEPPATLAWSGPTEDGGADLRQILASLPVLDRFIGGGPAEPVWEDGCPACGMG